MSNEDKAWPLRWPKKRQESPLVVTRHGVPVPDQEKGVEEFKDACRASRAYQRADAWARSAAGTPYGVTEAVQAIEEQP